MTEIIDFASNNVVELNNDYIFNNYSNQWLPYSHLGAAIPTGKTLRIFKKFTNKLKIINYGTIEINTKKYQITKNGNFFGFHYLVL